jgi:hypothetical protein
MEWKRENGMYCLCTKGLIFYVWQNVYHPDMPWRGEVTKDYATFVSVDDCESAEQAKAEIIAAFAERVQEWQDMAEQLSAYHA